MWHKQPTKNKLGVETFLGVPGFEASSLNIKPTGLFV